MLKILMWMLILLLAASGMLCYVLTKTAFGYA